MASNFIHLNSMLSFPQNSIPCFKVYLLFLLNYWSFIFIVIPHSHQITAHQPFLVASNPLDIWKHLMKQSFLGFYWESDPN